MCHAPPSKAICCNTFASCTGKLTAIASLPSCEPLSLFAVDGLTGLATITLNVLLCLLGWTAAYPRPEWPHRKSLPLCAGIVGLHLLASGATLLNTQAPSLVPEGAGCYYSLPALYTVVVVAGAITARVCAVAVCSPQALPRVPAASSDSDRRL